MVLLTGPASIGKRTICRLVVKHHGAQAADVKEVLRLNMETSREVQRFLSTRPMGKLKAVVARLDAGTSEALNGLLKLMEEPPDSARFLLTSSSPTLLTVQSRADYHQLGFLREEDVYAILTKKYRQPPDVARRNAQMSGGQVRKALNASEMDVKKGPVLSLIKGMADANEDLVHNALAKFSFDELTLMKRWCAECRTGRYRTFSKAEAFGLDADPRALDRIDRALRSGARPKIAARLAAAATMKER